MSIFLQAQLELTFDAPQLGDVTSDAQVWDEPNNRRYGHLLIEINGIPYVFGDMGSSIVLGPLNGPGGALSPEQLRVISEYCSRAADRIEVTRVHGRGNRTCTECGERMPCSAIRAVTHV